MASKLIMLTVMIAGLAAGLLVLRQQRLVLAHDMVILHRQILQARTNSWQAQTQAAALLAPAQLRQELQTTQIAMEPAVPTLTVPAARLALRTPPRLNHGRSR